MEPTRQIYWNIGGHAVLYVWGLLVVLSFLAAGLLRTWSRRRGLPKPRRRASLWSVLKTAVSLRGIRLGHLPLRMHRCLLYGFGLLLLATVLVGLQDHLGLAILRGPFFLGFELATDLAGLLLLVGLGQAVHIRYIKHAGRLENHWDDAALLALLTLIVISGFCLKGLRLEVTGDPWRAWSPVGFLAALAGARLLDPAQAKAAHSAIWHGHVVMAMLFLALIPWTKLSHILALPASLRYRRPDKEKNRLETPRGLLAAGTATLADLPPDARLEMDACMRCGRCRKQCPIAIGGAPFALMTFFQNEKRLLLTGAWNRPLVGSVISEEALWACTACRACEERCPLGGDFVERIVGLRRGQVARGILPAAVAERFHQAATTADRPARPLPTGHDAATVFLWPGCQTREAEGAAILDALTRLVRQAGLTPVVLEPPRCCSGVNRLLGNEARFQEDVRANMAYLRPLGNALIVTPCPHCYTTLKNEYPAGLTLQHHTQFLRALQAKGLLPAVSETAGQATYHDPCFLGRYHGGFEAPRELLQNLPGLTLVEMTDARKKSPCCGSGGGAATTASATKNARKLLDQATATGAGLLVTSCPYCRTTLQREGRLAVADIAEVLAGACLK